jgi:hypothetical protein
MDRRFEGKELSVENIGDGNITNVHCQSLDWKSIGQDGAFWGCLKTTSRAAFRHGVCSPNPHFSKTNTMQAVRARVRLGQSLCHGSGRQNKRRGSRGFSSDERDGVLTCIRHRLPYQYLSTVTHSGILLWEINPNFKIRSDKSRTSPGYYS